MTSVGDSFAWPFQDPGWFGKMIVQGLITIIPIVGWIATAGWLIMTIDNYRAGRRELPPAGFHLGRGIALFVVYLIYIIVFAIPGGILTGAASSNNNGGAAALGELINFLLSLLLVPRPLDHPAHIPGRVQRRLRPGWDMADGDEQHRHHRDRSDLDLGGEPHRGARCDRLLRRPAVHDSLQRGNPGRNRDLVRAAQRRSGAKPDTARVRQKERS